MLTVEEDLNNGDILDFYMTCQRKAGVEPGEGFKTSSVSDRCFRSGGENSKGSYRAGSGASGTGEKQKVRSICISGKRDF